MILEVVVKYKKLVGLILDKRYKVEEYLKDGPVKLSWWKN